MRANEITPGKLYVISPFGHRKYTPSSVLRKETLDGEDGIIVPVLAKGPYTQLYQNCGKRIVQELENIKRKRIVIAIEKKVGYGDDAEVQWVPVVVNPADILISYEEWKLKNDAHLVAIMEATALQERYEEERKVLSNAVKSALNDSDKFFLEKTSRYNREKEKYEYWKGVQISQDDFIRLLREAGYNRAADSCEELINLKAPACAND